MYFGHIPGLLFLPIGVILILNAFGITHVNSLFGLSLLLLASIGLIATQIGDIISSHFTDGHVILSYIVCTILCFPGLIYFISLFSSMPENLMAPLPLLLGSFLFVEGLSSLFIGD
jgi:hypothetical protein